MLSQWALLQWSKINNIEEKLPTTLILGVVSDKKLKEQMRRWWRLGVGQSENTNMVILTRSKYSWELCGYLVINPTVFIYIKEST